MIYISSINKKLKVWIYLAALMALAGCGEKEGETPGPAQYEIDREYRRGPVRFRVAVSREELTIAENVELLLQVTAEEGYSANLPSFGEKLENFGIVDYRTMEPELEDDGSIVKSRSYLLEPFLSGEYRIPPMTIEFHSEGDTASHYLRSDTLRVSVLSLMPGEDNIEDAVSLSIRDIAPPMEMPGQVPVPLIVTGGIIILAVAAALLYRLKRRKKKVVPPPAPHEIALARLQGLLDRDLAGQKRYIELTIEVSDILRSYIEGRFGIHAPEMTTEEFLHESGNSGLIGTAQKSILEQFLTHSDLVKFARLEPAAEDVQRTFDTCRDFIMETRIEKEVAGEGIEATPA